MGRCFARRGYTLTEVLVTLFILGLVVALLLPMRRTAGDAARRNACVNNIKQLGIALHTHHDAKRRIPLASSEPLGNNVGSVGMSPAGYSWLVPLLPFME